MKSNAQKLAENLMKQQLRLEGFLSAIESNTSIFRFIPTNIGKIIWCDTTNEKVDPNVDSSTFSKLFSKSFKGVDYFVGTEGFAEIHFDRSRENIVKSDVFRFESFSELLSNKTKITINYVDQGTRWNFSFFDIPDKIGYTDERIEFIKNAAIETIDVVFLKRIEDAWNKFKSEQMKQQFERDGYFSFNRVLPVRHSDRWGILPYIKVGRNWFEVEGIRFDSTNLRKAYFDNGDIYLMKKTDTLWNSIGFGKKNIITLQPLGNKSIFLTVFTNTVRVIMNDNDFNLKKNK